MSFSHFLGWANYSFPQALICFVCWLSNSILYFITKEVRNSEPSEAISNLFTDILQSSRMLCTKMWKGKIVFNAGHLHDHPLPLLSSSTLLSTAAPCVRRRRCVGFKKRTMHKCCDVPLSWRICFLSCSQQVLVPIIFFQGCKEFSSICIHITFRLN